MIEQKEHDFHTKNELVKLILHKKPQKALSQQLTKLGKMFWDLENVLGSL